MTTNLVSRQLQQETAFAFSNEDNSTTMIINPRLALTVLLAIMVVGNVHVGATPQPSSAPSKTKKVSMTLWKMCSCGVAFEFYRSLLLMVGFSLPIFDFVKYVGLVHRHCYWKCTDQEAQHPHYQQGARHPQGREPHRAHRLIWNWDGRRIGMLHLFGVQGCGVQVVCEFFNLRL